MRPTHCRVALHEPVGAHHLTQVVDRDRQVTLAQPVTGPGPPHQVGGRLCQVARVGQAADAGVEPADLCGLAHRQRLPPHPVAVRGGRSDSVDDLVQVVLPRGCGRGDPVDLEQVPHRQHRRHGVRPVHRAPALPSTQAASLGLSQHQHQLRPDARGHLAQHGQRRRDLCVAKGPQPVRVRTPQHLARHPGSPQHRATPTRAPPEHPPEPSPEVRFGRSGLVAIPRTLSATTDNTRPSSTGPDQLHHNGIRVLARWTLSACRRRPGGRGQAERVRTKCSRTGS